MNYLEKTSTHSPCFKRAKFYRDELDQLRKVKFESKTRDYAYCFLVLLSKSICQNVDTKNKSKIKNPNMYIKLSEFEAIFGIKKYQQTLEILNTLKNRYNAINYSIEKVFFNGEKQKIIYIHFNICNGDIKRGDYYEFYDLHHDTVTGIINNDGFILVDKKQLFKTFFKNNNSPQGPRDLYILLRLNMVFHSSEIADEIPDELKDYHIALFKFGMEEKPLNAEYSLLIQYKLLADALNVSVKTIYRYFKLLADIKLIDYNHLHKRGTFVIFRYLDRIEKIQDSNAAIKNAKILIESYFEEYEGRYIDDSLSLNNNHLMLLNYCSGKNEKYSYDNEDDNLDFPDNYARSA